MADIKVLMVFDGGRLNFGPAQTAADTDNFGVSQLYNTLSASTTPTIHVDRAHRRGHLFNFANLTDSNTQLIHENCSLNLDLPGDFVFSPPHNPPATTVTATLAGYDVIWIIGDEGNNGGEPGVYVPGATPSDPPVPVDAPITDDEKIAIAEFMEGQGGVFAVGDHDAIGFMMSGALPRIRTMRRWYEYDQGAAAGAVGNGQSFALNYSGYALAGELTDRNDTLIADSGDGLFYFNDQSDQSPQTLVTSSGSQLASAPPEAIDTLLRDAAGNVIGRFPDHMHEGIATDFATVSATGSPFDPNVSPGNPYSLTFNGALLGSKSFVEFPNPDGYQPQPLAIAFTQDSGHTTSVPNSPPPGATVYPASQPKTATGAISTYDGRAVGIGRIVTGSTFHHYLNKNQIGDPGTQAQPAGAMGGTGPTGSNTGFTSEAALLTSIGDYYVNAVTWLARPSRNFQFWTLKSTYGANEALVATQGFPDAFYLAIEGYTAAQVGTNPAVALSGPLAADGVTFTQGAAQVDAQRILIPFSVKAMPASAFPAAGGAPRVLALEARVTIGTDVLSAEALFELTADPDPFFANVGATNPPNEPYLSQDLRVFQFAPAAGPAPIIAFQNGWSGYDYMTHLLSQLNDASNGYTTGANDPFAQLNLGADLTEFSSVTPGASGAPNFPFALARVRVKNTVSAPIDNLRVFFRLFTTASNDTDFDPVVTYPSNLDAANLPGSPRNGLYGTTFVMTASGSVSTDYPGANQLSFTVPANAETYAYFGCFLDVYDAGSPIPAGGHHCLVAEIAYDGSPIVNSNGQTLSPESSSQLAQRNIVFAPIGNPAGPPGHQAPQTFDTRPSVRRGPPVQTAPGYPDELMIDWGEVPIGAVASIYWPQAAAIDVVRLATLLYAGHTLTVADAHTVAMTVTSRVTYVPIPFGDGPKLAGLFNIDVPDGVHPGQSFTIVVRRISTRSVPTGVVAEPVAQVRRHAAAAVTGPAPNTNWRYVVGTFQVTIPVDLEEPLLGPEEDALAIFKWRVQQWSPTDRWYPVLLRYLAYLSQRVDAFGGDAAAIPPSRFGAPHAGHGGHGGHGHAPGVGEAEYTGKVVDVIFDRFGDFEAFRLETFHGPRLFRSHEPEIGELVLRAQRERLLLSVVAEDHPPHAIRWVIVRV